MTIEQRDHLIARHGSELVSEYEATLERTRWRVDGIPRSGTEQRDDARLAELQALLFPNEPDE